MALKSLGGFILMVVLVGVAVGQSPIVMTESATTLGKGVMHVGTGVEYLTKTVPSSESIPSTLVRVLGASVHHGVAENVNFDLHWRGGLFAGFDNGKEFFDWGDLSVWTKINFFPETQSAPAVALRTGIKLPNTRFAPAKLGNNQTDYHSQVLISRRGEATEFRMGMGFSIVGDPYSAGSQDDLYSLQVAGTFDIGEGDFAFAELYGRTGYHDHDDKLVSRIGFVGSSAIVNWSVYGLVRLAGSHRDFAGAFDCSETWSLGVFLFKEFKIDL
jgi:hypothetical protein